MEAFHHKWSWIRNRTYVLPQRIAHPSETMTTGQVPTTKLETLFSQQNTLLIHLQVPQFLLNLLGLRTRITVPVPVRSKQRTSSTEDPQPKKKQKSASVPEPRVTTTESYSHPVPASHHLRDTSRRLQLWWFRLWRSIRSCFCPWSSGCRHQLSNYQTNQHHFHHSTWHFITTYFDTESKCTTATNHPHPSTKSCRSCTWPTISSMD